MSDMSPPAPTGRGELPMALAPAPERADAARNRARILEAASELLSESPEALTMDAIAARSGVGVATLYRRFGDRNGLLAALLDISERRFQDAFLTGPAPLGPRGSATATDPRRRIRAFVHALAARVESERTLRSAMDGRLLSDLGPYGAWRLHLRGLLVAVGPPDVPDADTWADTLLMLAGPGTFASQQARDLDRGAREQAIDLLLDRLLDARPDGRAFASPARPDSRGARPQPER